MPFKPLLLSASLLLALSMLLTAGCRGKASQANTPIPSAANTHPVKSAALGYTLDIPNDWTTQPPSGMVDLIAMSPKSGPQDNFLENVNVVSETLQKNMTPEEYYQANKAMMAQMMPKFSEDSNSTLTGNETGKKMAYSWTMNNGLQAKVATYFFVHDKHGFVVTCSATPESYTSFETQFDQIAQSFRF